MGEGDCLVCGRAARRVAGRVYTADAAAAQLCPPERSAERHAKLRDTISVLWNGESARRWVCDTCGFGFAQPHVAGDEAMYSLLHEDPSYPAGRWEYDRVLGELRRGELGGRLLDYGAGDGAFLRRLPASWQKGAVEASPVLRRALAQMGVECFDMGTPGARSLSGPFDVITMFQVLEHIADFACVLESCYAALRPGGRLFVSVPEGERIRQWEAETGLPDIPPFHINQWTRRSLAMALAAAGLVDIATATDPWTAANTFALLSNGLRAEVNLPGSLGYRAWAIRDRRVRRAAFVGAAPLYAPKLLRLAVQAPMLCRGVILLAQATRPEY